MPDSNTSSAVSISAVSIPFIDLGAQQVRCRDEIDAAIAGVLAHGKYVLGPEVGAFERALVTFSDAEYVVSCANGTDALSLVLMAWGIGAGDGVFVPNFTYVATAGAVAAIGAVPIFVDVAADSFNLAPRALAAAITDAHARGLNPKAVIAVDLFGQPCDADELTNIAHAADLKLLIDAAQSFGAGYRGMRVGGYGDAATTSFFPSKPLGGYGDGGAIFTNDRALADTLLSLRFHGRSGDEHIRIGLNSRLDTIQAAILMVKLNIFDDECAARERIATYYTKAFTSAMRAEQLQPPVIADGKTSAWAQYTLKITAQDIDRTRLRDHLTTHNIPSMIYYPRPLSEHPAYRHFPSAVNGTPIADTLCNMVLSIPMHPYLTERQQNRIIAIIEEALT